MLWDKSPTPTVENKQLTVWGVLWRVLLFILFIAAIVSMAFMQKGVFAAIFGEGTYLYSVFTIATIVLLCITELLRAIDIIIKLSPLNDKHTTKIKIFRDVSKYIGVFKNLFGMVASGTGIYFMFNHNYQLSDIGLLIFFVGIMSLADFCKDMIATSNAFSGKSEKSEGSKKNNHFAKNIRNFLAKHKFKFFVVLGGPLLLGCISYACLKLWSENLALYSKLNDIGLYSTLNYVSTILLGISVCIYTVNLIVEISGKEQEGGNNSFVKILKNKYFKLTSIILFASWLIFNNGAFGYLKMQLGAKTSIALSIVMLVLISFFSLFKSAQSIGLLSKKVEEDLTVGPSGGDGAAPIKGIPPPPARNPKGHPYTQ